ncbi:MAG TPA: metallophosphoesterase [Nevskiaceae bacterium]|nr:metallophosphoesterase [Nevskiaceae bacterium]
MRRSPLAIAIALSLLLHGYVAWRIVPALALSPAGAMIALLLLCTSAVLLPMPLLIRLSRLPTRAADALAWAGYLCMGMFSTLFVLTLLRDALLALAWIANAAGADLDLASLARSSALGALALAALVSVVGLVNARRVARVVQVELPIENLPPALAGFSIVQISDIHVGPTIKRGYLDAIVRRVNALEADLVAITGDVIDGSVQHLQPHVAPLQQLRSRHGSYIVTGNHEYYHGVHAWLDEWQRLGLRVLHNRGEVIEHGGAKLLIGGVTDFSAHHFDESHRSDAQAAARGDAPVKVLLAHQPRSAPAAEAAGFDLQLSGHTHGGQFWPWNLFVPMQQPFVAGLERLGRLWVYTSRGTGYWGPPIRFGAPSEITRITLVAR